MQELYLMCPDIEAALADLAAKGVTISHPVRDMSWGLWATIQLPSGADLSLYQPRHPTAYDLGE
jgi:predicted enzyme related to lactoylglutathione lyase